MNVETKHSAPSFTLEVSAVEAQALLAVLGPLVSSGDFDSYPMYSEIYDALKVSGIDPHYFDVADSRIVRA